MMSRRRGYLQTMLLGIVVIIVTVEAISVGFRAWSAGSYDPTTAVTLPGIVSLAVIAIVTVIGLASMSLAYVLIHVNGQHKRATVPQRLVIGAGLGLGELPNLVMAASAAILRGFHGSKCRHDESAHSSNMAMPGRGRDTGDKFDRGMTLPLLLTWLSPAFPTGAYAYSHGLEWAIEARDVTDEATTAAWLADVLAYGAGRSDAILLRHAYRASTASGLAEVAALAAAAQPCAERRLETLAQGTAFALAGSIWGAPLLAAQPGQVAYPVAVGALAAAHDVPENEGGTRPAACLRCQFGIVCGAAGAVGADRRVAHSRRARPAVGVRRP